MTALPVLPPRSSRSQQQAIGFATELILQTCCASPDPTYLKRMRASLTRQGIRAAVAQHDTPALFDWLIEVASYQDISDSIAWAYMEEHGRITWADLHTAYERGPSSPKLVSFEAFSGCRYRKAGRTCAQPEHFPACPLPTRPLRRGAVNQPAYALYLFLRDECRGGLVAWIDGQLATVGLPGAPDRAQRMRE